LIGVTLWKPVSVDRPPRAREVDPCAADEALARLRDAVIRLASWARWRCYAAMTPRRARRLGRRGGPVG
jgi:hypothetical protein